MDLKSVLLQGEDALPTLEQSLSTRTASALSFPVIAVDASTCWKAGGGSVMGLAGMLYLGYGKKHGDVRKMVIGAALTFGSVLLF